MSSGAHPMNTRGMARGRAGETDKLRRALHEAERDRDDALDLAEDRADQVYA